MAAHPVPFTGGRSGAVALPDWGGAAPADATARPLELAPAEGRPVGTGTGGARQAAAWASGYRDGRAEGYAEGHELGRADGAAAAAEAARVAATAAAAAVHDAVAAELVAVHERLDALERDAVDLALALATEVLGHHVAAATDPGRDALLRALSAARPRGPVVAHLHPDDLALVDPTALPVVGAALELVPDASVGRGGCVLEAGHRRVDATVEGAVRRLRTALADGGTR